MKVIQPLLNYYSDLHGCLVRIQSKFWYINQKPKPYKTLCRQVNDDVMMFAQGRKKEAFST